MKNLEDRMAELEATVERLKENSEKLRLQTEQLKANLTLTQALMNKLNQRKRAEMEQTG